MRETWPVPWSPLTTRDGVSDRVAPVELSDALDKVLAALGAPATDSIVLIHEQWDQVVGKELSEHCYPISIEDKCLKIGVHSAAWAGHLKWSQEEVLVRLERLVGPEIVKSINAKVQRPR